MRLVTFQSRKVTDTLIDTGIVETVRDFKGTQFTSSQLGRTNSDVNYLRVDGQIMKYSRNDDSNYELVHTIHKAKSKVKIHPFYAYHKHRYCGDMRYMGIHTIYRLASHFIASMNYERRDIIELEVPDSEILEIVSSNGDYEECLLPCIKKDWVISILQWVDYVDEPVHGELAHLYFNKVFREDTYRMCYSKDIVLSGHGYADDVDACMCPNIIQGITDSFMQKDYVQPGVWNLFKRYCYLIRHDMKMSDITTLKAKVVNAEMPDEFREELIDSFNVCFNELCRLTGIKVHECNTSYTDRIPEYRDCKTMNLF